MWSYIKSHLNFYRIHLLLFIFIPLFSAIIFWASNGEFPVKFIDALFVCVSGVTGTGLSTIDFSSLTIWQQVIIAVLELIGNQTFVAWIVVMVRRQYFLNHLEYIVAAELERTYTHHDTSMSLDATSSIRRFRTIFRRRKGAPWRKESLRAVVRRQSSVDGVHDAPSYMHNIEGTTATGVEVEHLSRITSRRSIATSAPIEHDEGEFGGFPGPRQLVSRAMRRIFPGLHRNLRRTVTMPRTSTLIPQTCNIPATPSAGPTRTVPYFSFSAIVGRNSAFSGLTAENIEELGGVEYRALTSLLWIVPLYYVGLLSISFIVIAPYMTLPRWQYNFVPPQQHKVISPIWFSAMQVIGAWANTEHGAIPDRIPYDCHVGNMCISRKYLSSDIPSLPNLDPQEYTACTFENQGITPFSFRPSSAMLHISLSCSSDLVAVWDRAGIEFHELVL
ncbi:Low-affinity potassium transport protein [Grifola frondosa]|uniref:Low-affinity potassium transport protein n=1 Tax=Grifola frondosa TaxID=5627 RepID=A0A1C7M845_GRIFR|nr:Low-affinity potassium transport protein [Grifola frondosa]